MKSGSKIVGYYHMDADILGHGQMLHYLHNSLTFNYCIQNSTRRIVAYCYIGILLLLQCRDVQFCL